MTTIYRLSEAEVKEAIAAYVEKETNEENLDGSHVKLIPTNDPKSGAAQLTAEVTVEG